MNKGVSRGYDYFDSAVLSLSFKSKSFPFNYEQAQVTGGIRPYNGVLGKRGCRSCEIPAQENNAEKTPVFFHIDPLKPTEG